MRVSTTLVVTNLYAIAVKIILDTSDICAVLVEIRIFAFVSRERKKRREKKEKKKKEEEVVRAAQRAAVSLRGIVKQFG